MKKSILASLLAALGMAIGTTSAGAAELVGNGDFETGTLSGWSNSGLGSSGNCPSGNRDWNVSNSSTATGCNFPSNPAGGGFAAYVMNDGTGPLTYRLMQSVFVPTGTVGGTLSFDWTSINGSDPGRLLSVFLDGTSIFSSSTAGGFDWAHLSFDVGGLLAANAGSSILLEFDNYIPQTWSGPAGLGLDNVSIDASVPEPASLALAGIGLLALASRRRKS